MKRSTVVIIALLLASFLGSMLLLRYYKLDLIHAVVEDALLQKAPHSYPAERIRKTLSAARLKAEAEAWEQVYLERLLRVSQRLEKVQQLSHSDLDRLLESVHPGALSLSGSPP